NWQLLSWANVTNVSAVDSAGVASYRFFFIDAGERRESEVFYGPDLGLYPTPTPTPTVIYSGGGGGGGGGLTWRKLLGDEKLMGELAEELGVSNISRDGGVVAINPPELINATVTPENGSWHESYDYLVEVEHPDRADMWLTLEVCCPGQRENYTISTQRVWLYDDANIAKVEWHGVNVFNESDVRVNESPEYYIRYNDGYNKGFWGLYPGPKLFFPPNLTDPSVSPAEGTYKEQFEYKVHITDEEGDDVNVTLYIFDSEGSEIYNETQVINGTEAKRGKTESWIYNKFTKEAADREFRYYFSATDGIVSNTTGEIRVGPYIKPGPMGTLSWIYPELLFLVIGLLVGLLLFSGISLIKSKKIPLVKSKQDFESWLSSMPENKIENILKVLKKPTPQVSRSTDKEKVYETLMSYSNREITFEELKEQLRGKRIIEEEI
ncbi:MAG: hypothetical protein IMF19_09665, partial [Proteobacteria bacterium]|nr:hypothetical protein [Pseudomonadota bacterium]